jgi:hypothetical protein
MNSFLHAARRRKFQCLASLLDRQRPTGCSLVEMDSISVMSSPAKKPCCRRQ